MIASRIGNCVLVRMMFACLRRKEMEMEMQVERVKKENRERRICIGRIDGDDGPWRGREGLERGCVACLLYLSAEYVSASKNVGQMALLARRLSERKTHDLEYG